MITAQQGHLTVVPPPDRATSAEQAVCTLPVTPAAAPALRHFATTSARGWGLGDDVRDALALVVTELVANVVLHSGSADVTLRLHLLPTQRSVRVEVRDAGHWHPRPARPDPAAPLDADEGCAERGRGLAIVEACALRTAVRLTPDGTTVRADLPLG
ncbi:ATP-binding protein [Streptomyces chumphonensis]|uniref:ATP-binding protein n=1 Tax=Streptomyces chumphonensis TaxID=1214925 RepID=UPI003D748572